MSAEEALRRQEPIQVSGLGALATRYFRRLAFGQLLVKLPDGSEHLFRGPFEGRSAELEIRAPLRMATRIITRGDIGFAEAYLDGLWTTPDLTAVLDCLYFNYEHLGSGTRGVPGAKRWNRIVHRLRRNHRRGSRRNIARHYDLGNDFYRLWLDPSMTYSSAVFTDREHEDLEAAQARKYELLLDSLNAAPGSRLLEIGCGWGGLAEAAARRGHHVTAVTLSREQLDYARQRLEAAGLADRVDLRLQDYRDLQGKYDHIVSIEMVEAVGEDYWPTYFGALRRLLRPGGRIALQAITIRDDDFERYRHSADFIQLYIFPGGMLFSPQRLEQEAAAAGLRIDSTRWYGLDYAETLRRWHRRFRSAAGEVGRLGYDQSFHRMWQYYLSYCEVGFEAGSIDLVQAVLEPAQ